MELLTTYEFTRPEIPGEFRPEECTLAGRIELYGEFKVEVKHGTGGHVATRLKPVYTVKEHGKFGGHIAEFTCGYFTLGETFPELAAAAHKFAVTK